MRVWQIIVLVQELQLEENYSDYFRDAGRYAGAC
jgi:hypothetical protein